MLKEYQEWEEFRRSVMIPSRSAKGVEFCADKFESCQMHSELIKFNSSWINPLQIYQINRSLDSSVEVQPPQYALQCRYYPLEAVGSNPASEPGHYCPSVG